MDRLLWVFLEHLVYHVSSEHGTLVEIGWIVHQAALIPFFYIGKLLFAYSISAWTKFLSRLWQEGTEANTFGSVINLSTGKPRNYAFVETTFE